MYKIQTRRQKAKYAKHKLQKIEQKLYKRQTRRLSIMLGRLFVPISRELLTEFGSWVIALQQICASITCQVTI